MPKRRKYSPEFKKGAVEQVRQPGVSCAQVARELGVGANLLSRWQREADASVQQACAGDIKTLLLEFYWAICRPDRDWRVIKFDGVA